jgi:hypothetical protein
MPERLLPISTKQVLTKGAEYGHTIGVTVDVSGGCALGIIGF